MKPAARFNELIPAVKEKGGLFVIPHPSATNDTVPENAMDLYFQDETGFEVFYGNNATDNNNWKTQANYKLWTDLLAAGKRIWATSGNDDHGLPETICLSTVYSEAGNAQSHITHLRVGDFTAGPVGIRMCVGNTPMGSTGSFEGQRLVFCVSDFHESALIEGHTYTVKLLENEEVIGQWISTARKPSTTLWMWMPPRSTTGWRSTMPLPASCLAWAIPFGIWTDEVNEMKSTYIAPEAKLSCFVSTQALSTLVDFDDLYALSGAGQGDPVVESQQDIDLDLRDSRDRE